MGKVITENQKKSNTKKVLKGMKNLFDTLSEVSFIQKDLFLITHISHIQKGFEAVILLFEQEKDFNVEIACLMRSLFEKIVRICYYIFFLEQNKEEIRKEFIKMHIASKYASSWNVPLSVQKEYIDIIPEELEKYNYSKEEINNVINEFKNNTNLKKGNTKDFRVPKKDFSIIFNDVFEEMKKRGQNRDIKRELLFFFYKEASQVTHGQKFSEMECSGVIYLISFINSVYEEYKGEFSDSAKNEWNSLAKLMEKGVI